MKLSIPAACGGLLVFGVAHAADLSITFDHLTETNLTRPLEPKPGDLITTTVTSTCPGRFLYTSIALAKSPEKPPGVTEQEFLASCDVEQARQLLESQGFCRLANQDLEFVHRGENSGYIIEVRKKVDAPAKVFGLTTAAFDAAAGEVVSSNCSIPDALRKRLESPKAALKDTSYYVAVHDSPWAIGMSGGISISSVVDPRFAIVNDAASTSSPPGTIVIRDKGAEDGQKLGFAGYLHIHHEKFKAGPIPLAVTFGLGIEDQSTINAMIGLSAAASDLAYITLGYNWSSVDRLPAGQQLGKSPINENVLNDLPKRTDGGWFLGVSFKFMSPGEGFFKGKVIPKVENADAGDAS